MDSVAAKAGLDGRGGPLLLAGPARRRSRAYRAPGASERGRRRPERPPPRPPPRHRGARPFDRAAKSEARDLAPDPRSGGPRKHRSPRLHIPRAPSRDESAPGSGSSSPSPRTLGLGVRTLKGGTRVWPRIEAHPGTDRSRRHRLVRPRGSSGASRPVRPRASVGETADAHEGQRGHRGHVLRVAPVPPARVRSALPPRPVDLAVRGPADERHAAGGLRLSLRYGHRIPAHALRTVGDSACEGRGVRAAHRQWLRPPKQHAFDGRRAPTWGPLARVETELCRTKAKRAKDDSPARLVRVMRTMPLFGPSPGPLWQRRRSWRMRRRPRWPAR